MGLVGKACNRRLMGKRRRNIYDNGYAPAANKKIRIAEDMGGGREFSATDLSTTVLVGVAPHIVKKVGGNQPRRCLCVLLLLL